MYVHEVLKSLRKGLPLSCGSSVSNDVSTLLQEAHIKYITKNVDQSFKTVNANGHTVSERKAALDLCAKNCMEAALNADDANVIRMYALLIYHYDLSCLILDFHPHSLKDFNKEKVHRLYELFSKMSLWSDSLKKLFEFDYLCSYIAMSMFQPRMEGSLRISGSVQPSNQQIYTNAVSLNGKDASTLTDSERTAILTQFRMPQRGFQLPVSLWRKVMPMPTEKSDLKEYLQIVCFFQTYLVSQEARNLEEYSAICKALTELLDGKRKCVENLVVRLEDEELLQMFFTDMSVYASIARDSVKVNALGMNRSHLLQKYEAWYAEHMLSCIESRCLPVPDLNFDPSSNKQQPKKLRLHNFIH